MNFSGKDLSSLKNARHLPGISIYRLVFFFTFCVLFSSCAYLVKYSSYRGTEQPPGRKSCMLKSADGSLSVTPTTNEDVWGLGPVILPIPFASPSKLDSVSFWIEPIGGVGVLDKTRWTLDLDGEKFNVTDIDKKTDSAWIQFKIPERTFKHVTLLYSGPKSTAQFKWRHTHHWMYLPFAIHPMLAAFYCD